MLRTPNFYIGELADLRRLLPGTLWISLVILQKNLRYLDHPLIFYDLKCKKIIIVGHEIRTCVTIVFFA